MGSREPTGIGVHHERLGRGGGFGNRGESNSSEYVNACVMVFRLSATNGDHDELDKASS